MASKMTLSAIQKAWKTLNIGHNTIHKNLTFTAFENSFLTAEIPVSKEILNHVGVVHGGYTASLIDTCNASTMMANAIPGAPGFTVDLHISYVKSAKMGDIICATARPVKTGRNLAYVECELRNKADDSIIARCNATMYIGS